METRRSGEVSTESGSDRAPVGSGPHHPVCDHPVRSGHPSLERRGAKKPPLLKPGGEPGGFEIEYIEVELADIALANELAEEVLGKAMDELAPPVRGMFEAITKACRQKAAELNIKPVDVQLTRREIREMTAWSDWQVRMYCQKLVEMEYLWAIVSTNGKPSVYQLAGDAESEVHSLRGLTSVDELKRKLKDAAKVKAATP